MLANLRNTNEGDRVTLLISHPCCNSEKIKNQAAVQHSYHYLASDIFGLGRERQQSTKYHLDYWRRQSISNKIIITGLVVGVTELFSSHIFNLVSSSTNNPDRLERSVGVQTSTSPLQTWSSPQKCSWRCSMAPGRISPLLSVSANSSITYTSHYKIYFWEN